MLMRYVGYMSIYDETANVVVSTYTLSVSSLPLNLRDIILLRVLQAAAQKIH
jgi:hypothetical protein